MLTWLAGHGEHGFEVVLLRGGPQLEAFRKVGRCSVLDGSIRRAASRGLDGIASVSGRRVSKSWLLGAGRRSRASDVVVANTLAALDVAAMLRAKGASLVCHVHELDHTAERVLGRVAERRRLLDSVDRFIATGDPVARMLIERWGIPEQKVVTVDAFVVAEQPAMAAVDEARTSVTDRRGQQVVLSMGAMSARKGPDRFVDLIGVLRARSRDVSGVWLGGNGFEAEWLETLGDVERSGLTGSVRLLQTMKNPLAMLAAADVVVSTAREDPYPLSVLEAGALGVPVVAFDSGGSGEILRSAGCADSVVALGDSFAMADRVCALLADEVLRESEGSRLRSWVEETHDPASVAPRLWSAIKG